MAITEEGTARRALDINQKTGKRRFRSCGLRCERNIGRADIDADWNLDLKAKRRGREDYRWVADSRFRDERRSALFVAGPGAHHAIVAAEFKAAA
jgi:hypothetical protein